MQTPVARPAKSSRFFGRTRAPYRASRGARLRPFPLPLREGLLVRRWRRFLAEVRLPDGRMVTAHCANPGAMTGCCEPGRPVLLSRSDRPGRKLSYTWEMIRMGRSWVGVNTATANRAVRHWLEMGRLLPGPRPVRPEAVHGRSRFDFALGANCLLEVKSVTMASGGVAAFPDAVTDRGRRHVEELGRLARGGMRCILLYFVTRADARCVRPADEVDPAYGHALREAVAAGLEVRAVQARFSRRGVALGPALRVGL
ncbi:MAG: DNA/RNA nuclease SfsA [Planctomycetaceae bacterium]